ncbi:unnamed protein product [Hymenolepis diminuta]|uniref:RRM domain-containing protein n=1 Tax=Hymenolepis diminuta TaxID=6216 RepID=A0A158QC94_HYMDI|nr:unnamed protein product [Hymenolepis diminuta]
MQTAHVYTGSKRRHDGVVLSHNYNDSTVNQAVYEQLQALIRTKKIFVGGLPQNTKEEDLVNFFSQYGAVDHADLIREKENGRFRGANTYLGPTINNPSVTPVAAGPPNPALTPLPIPPNYLQTTGLNDSANTTLSVTQPSASQVPQQPRLPLPTNLSYPFGQEPITQFLLSSMQTAQTTPYPNTQPLMYNPSTFMTDFAQLPYGGLNPVQVIQSLNANTQTGYYNQVPMPATQQLDPIAHYYAQLSQQLNPAATALLQQIQAGHAIRFPIATVPTPVATNTITYDQAIASNDRLVIPMPTAQPAAIQQGPRLNTYSNANGQGTSSSTPKPSNSTEKQPSTSQPKADLVDVASSSMPAKMPR